jgi:hypothetical protein
MTDPDLSPEVLDFIREHGRYGSFSAIADLLTAMGDRDVSRQGVRNWWMRRSRNGFPDHIPGRRRHQFDKTEVARWYLRYTPPPTSHWKDRNECDVLHGRPARGTSARHGAARLSLPR